MPVSSATPSIPVFRSNVICSRVSTHRHRRKYPLHDTRSLRQPDFHSGTQQRQITAGFGRHLQLSEPLHKAEGQKVYPIDFPRNFPRALPTSVPLRDSNPLLRMTGLDYTQPLALSPQPPALSPRYSALRARAKGQQASAPAESCPQAMPAPRANLYLSRSSLSRLGAVAPWPPQSPQTPKFPPFSHTGSTALSTQIWRCSPTGNSIL